MWILFCFLVIVATLVIYTAFDNRRIKIRRQNVRFGNNNLIRILQITDLHSKILRKNDYNKINKLNYDVIAFTGDIFVDEDKEYTCLTEFMKNVANTKNVVYVDGNNGKIAYNRKNNTLTSFGKYLESIGITVIKDYTEVKNVIFTNYNAVTSKLLDNDEHGKYYIYDRLNKEMINSKKISVGVTHYPLTEEAINVINKSKDIYIPSLIIAGHYHGGQIRFPLFGAILIPRYLRKGYRLFPNQKLVSGLYEKGKVKQYISRGVGATTHVKLLSFRFLNTPEIDLIILYY